MTMNPANVGLLFIVLLIILSFYSYYRLTFYPYYADKISKYPLFAVRDKLVRLVAEEKVSENDVSFQFLYRLTNSLTRVSKTTSLPELVEALSRPIQPSDP